MSKARFFGTPIDLIFQGSSRRPAYKVYLWNPNRANITDVVLDQSESPRYDITPFVISVALRENISFENSDNAVSTNATITLHYLPDALPIQITERTLLDGAPIRIYQGDESIPDVEQWVPVFTGVIRGNPGAIEQARFERQPQTATVVAVGREENFLNTVITARAYQKGTDIGRAVVETAIEKMGLDRREIKVGFQDYALGHTQNQLVDIEVLKGIHQMLFTVGKKPRFDADGFFTAADTDLDRAPTRVLSNDMIVEIRREQRSDSVNNSVRLVGLDNELTQVIEREKRLAHGETTSGFFESTIKKNVFFSENAGVNEGGRRALGTRIEKNINALTSAFGASLTWAPFLEPDAISTFGGRIIFDTGFAPELNAVLTGTFVVSESAIIALRILVPVTDPTVFSGAVAIRDSQITALKVASNGAITLILGSILALGRVEWEIFGQPFQNVFQQLAALATLDGVLSKDLKEIEFRNDWIYDIDVLAARAKELLKRELAKAWRFKITMLDDPVLDVDDIIEITSKKYYITSINRTMTRVSGPIQNMVLTAWRIS